MTSFEKKVLLLAGLFLLFIVGFFTGIFYVNHSKYDLTEAYIQYYNGSEELLDTLNNHYNWVDAIDVDNYYKAVAHLDSVVLKLKNR